MVLCPAWAAPGAVLYPPFKSERGGCAPNVIISPYKQAVSLHSHFARSQVVAGRLRLTRSGSLNALFARDTKFFSATDPKESRGSHILRFCPPLKGELFQIIPLSSHSQNGGLESITVFRAPSDPRSARFIKTSKLWAVQRMDISLRWNLTVRIANN